MPFPESERVIYGKNPLTEVICQLRFPTILRIGTEQVADFQDRIRQDYPLYEARGPSVQFPDLPEQFAPIVASMQLPKTAQVVTHRFSTVDNSRAISLSQDFVALVESRYERWESFRDEMRKGETALRNVYKPAFYSRIGLRYRDMIMRSSLGLSGVPWKELLKPHVLGVLGEDGIADQVRVLRTETLIAIPDIPHSQVKIIHGVFEDAATKEECYSIDSDFSTHRKGDTSDPFEVLDRFHRLAGCLFRWTITDNLHTAMEPSTI
jgi:uncharacterized protein (TIGR04255 family)